MTKLVIEYDPQQGHFNVDNDVAYLIKQYKHAIRTVSVEEWNQGKITLETYK